MKFLERNKYFIFMLLILVLGGYNILKITDIIPTTPKYKAGDCVKYQKYTEEWEEPYISAIIILQLGKKSYGGIYLEPKILRGHAYTQTFEVTDSLYTKVDCEEFKK